jgi:hypothetical protein
LKLQRNWMYSYKKELDGKAIDPTGAFTIRNGLRLIKIKLGDNKLIVFNFIIVNEDTFGNT